MHSVDLRVCTWERGEPMTATGSENLMIDTDNPNTRMLLERKIKSFLAGIRATCIHTPMRKCLKS